MAKKRFFSYQINNRKIRRKYYKLAFNLILFITLIDLIPIQSTSEIHLTISGNGNQALVNENFIPAPSEVWINGIQNTDCGRTCKLTGESNNIILKFTDQLVSCDNMFKNLENITKIDLSNFDASKLTSMDSMFFHCSNLEKVTFGNINTSSVENMAKLFQECYNLKTFDVFNLDTSKLKTTESMFNRCYQISSFDLSNFDTSQVTNMIWMFNDCTNLETINF